MRLLSRRSPIVWLLDESLPTGLFKHLNSLGIQVETVAFRKWKGFRNGKLVEAAATSGFKGILTRDKLFAQDAKKALVMHSQIAVVFISLPQIPLEKYVRLFQEQWTKSKIIPISGQVSSWP